MCPRQGWMPRAGGLTWRVLVMEVASRLRVIHPSTWLAVPTGKLALIPDLATVYQRSKAFRGLWDLSFACGQEAPNGVSLQAAPWCDMLTCPTLSLRSPRCCGGHCGHLRKSPAPSRGRIAAWVLPVQTAGVVPGALFYCKAPRCLSTGQACAQGQKGEVGRGRLSAASFL